MYSLVLVRLRVGSMEARVILSGKNEDLTLQEALNLLQNAVRNPELVSYVPPVKPKAGDVFVYSPGENLHKIGEFSFCTYALKLAIYHYVLFVCYFRWLEMWSVQMVPKQCQETTEEESSCAQAVLCIRHSRWEQQPL